MKPTNYPVTFMGIDRPSKAVRAMIAGLLAAKERPTFTINMETYGQYYPSEDMCYGCAATCALMNLTGDERLVKTAFTETGGEVKDVDEWLDGTVISTYQLQKSNEEDAKALRRFESAINSCRSSSNNALVKFFGLVDPRANSRPYFYMGTGYWEESIPSAIALAESWEKDGL